MMASLEERPKTWAWLWLPLTAAALWRVLPWPAQLWGWAGARFSDLLITHLPNALLIHRSLVDWGQFPLWNPNILGGMPLVGDPLAGAWYPPLWLAIAFPALAVFNVLIWLHLAWAGWGMFRLAKLEGLSDGGGWIAGLVFAASPKLLGQYGLGHVTLVMAVCWTPWVLEALLRWLRSGAGPGARPAAAALKLGTLVGVVFLADPRWLIPCVMLAAAVALRLALASRSEIRDRWRTWAATGALAIGQSALLAAWLSLPMWELVRLSTRAALDPNEVAALSLPAARFAGLIVPDLGGWPEWMTYLGIGSLMLMLLAAVLRRPGWGFWLAVVGGAWLLAVGNATPVFPLLANIVPGLSLLRVPARFLFVGILGAAILAGLGWDALQNAEAARRENRTLNLLAAGWMAVFLVLGGAGVVAPANWAGAEIRPGLVLAGVVGVVCGVFVLARSRLAFTRRGWMVVWLALILADLGVMDGSLLQAKAVPAPPPAVVGLEAAPALSGGPRLFSPSYSVPQDVAARFGLELADGVNPLQLANTWDFMSEATGFPDRPYSVTLPPFPAGDPQTPWAVRLDLDRLGWLAVAHVVSAYPLDNAALSLGEGRAGEVVYTNPAARPRAWVQAGQGLDPAPGWRAVAEEDWTPNKIRIEASGPGRLVLSEVNYPGWLARVDGAPAPIDVAGGLLRSVLIPAGEHVVVFEFLPWPAAAGVFLSLVGLALATWAWWRR